MSRETVEAFSTRRAEIEAAVAERAEGGTAANPRLAERAALMTRARKREVDKEVLRESWQKQAEGLGFDARALAQEALSRAESPSRDNSRELPMQREGALPETEGNTGAGIDPDAESREKEKPFPVQAAEWALAHQRRARAVFCKNRTCLPTTLAWRPGAVRSGEPEKPWTNSSRNGILHKAEALSPVKA